jgi:hypothetical protein
MGRRPGDRRFTLTPRGRRVAGWVAALAALGVVTLAVRVIGGTGDGTPVAPGESPASRPAVAVITFGTSLDDATGLVAITSRTSSFAAGQTFAYAAPDLGVVPTVYVAVERADDATVVQPATPQRVLDGAPVAFSVPADALIDAFGPGDYRMTMYLAPDAPVAAEGTFTLEGAPPSP